MTTRILGYTEEPLRVESEDNQPAWDYNTRTYIFRPITETPRGMITTMAFLMCSECGSAIKSSGGPGHNSYCPECYEQLKLLDFSQGHEHEIRE